MSIIILSFIRHAAVLKMEIPKDFIPQGETDRTNFYRKATTY